MASRLAPELLEFVAHELRVQPSRLRATTSLRELGVDGDDGIELLAAFATRFSVNLSGFDASLHFGPEAGFSPIAWLWLSINGTRSRLRPIHLADLQRSIDLGRWAGTTDASA